MTTPLQQHELSALFPAIPEAEFRVLVQDVKRHGLRTPITLYEGKVLDGWHRYRACVEAKVEPRAEEYDGDDPAGLAGSLNLPRRHLTPSQRALVEVGLNAWRPSGMTNAAAGGPPGSTSKSTAQMAVESKTSPMTIKRAKAVAVNGSDALKAAVRDGKVSLKAAAKAVKHPKEKQVSAATAKPASKSPEPEDEMHDTLAKELEEADKTIRSQQALIESLKKDDLAKEVARWKLKFDQLEGRLQQVMTTEREAKKQAAYAMTILTTIRKALKVTKNSEILAAIQKLK